MLKNSLFQPSLSFNFSAAPFFFFSVSAFFFLSSSASLFSSFFYFCFQRHFFPFSTSLPFLLQTCCPFKFSPKYYFQPKMFLLQPKILFQFSPKILFSAQNFFASAQDTFSVQPNNIIFSPKRFCFSPRYFFSLAQKSLLVCGSAPPSFCFFSSCLSFLPLATTYCPFSTQVFNSKPFSATSCLFI